MDCKKVTESIQRELAEYVKANGIKALITGVSGGIDSALSCALARPVCEYLGIGLIGRSIPIATNKTDEIIRAKNVGESFCTDFKECDLSAFYTEAARCLIEDDPVDETRTGKIRRGNLKARMRMVRLYDLANKHRGMVLSNDNYDELMLGFWTTAGDIGDFGMIQNLWKTEVYELAEWIEKSLRSDGYTSRADALKACIAATPTDGLGITSSDLEQLGANTYKEVDEILKTWLCEDEDCHSWDTYLKWEGRPEDYGEFVKYRESLRDHPVVKRHIATDFKRKVPINISRRDMDIDED